MIAAFLSSESLPTVSVPYADALCEPIASPLFSPLCGGFEHLLILPAQWEVRRGRASRAGRQLESFNRIRNSAKSDDSRGLLDCPTGAIQSEPLSRTTPGAALPSKPQ